jgi:phosphoenolpyruvate carboxykinase (ATP)
MSNFDLQRFAETSARIRKKALEEGRLIDNPSISELRKITENEPGVKKTIYGNLVAESEPTSRAAKFTQNSVDFPFGEAEEKLLKQCEEALAQEKLLSIDRIVGNPEHSKTTVRLIISERFAHIAYGGGNLFWPTPKSLEEPTIEIILFTDDDYEKNKSKPLPEKNIMIRLAMLPDGRIIKICRNSNYIGEYKKGVFASVDWKVKADGDGIFLHAGCREDRLQTAHGAYENVTSLLVALSANGKTTTTGKVLARKEREVSWLIQDDGGTLTKDGAFLGFEAGGIFVKTEDVIPEEQLEIYYGLLKPATLCENVYVTEDGDFDFFNRDKTANGRAVIRREDFMHASRHVDVNKIDNLILITRGPLIPAISKLTTEQAVALMVLGQAMESSAGDPTKAGQIRNEFFYDPFVSGDKVEHATIFYEILNGLPHLNCYLINTGGIGEDESYKKIEIKHTMGILDSLLRGGLEDWTDSPTGFKIPEAVRTVDSIFMHPEKLYTRSEFEAKQKELERIRYKTMREIEETSKGKLPNIVREVFKYG